MRRSTIYLTLLISLLSLLWVPLSTAWEAPRYLTEGELDKFIVDFPRFYHWSRDKGIAGDDARQQGFLLNPGQVKKARAYLRQLGWQPDRFFSIFKTIYFNLMPKSPFENMVSKEELNQAIDKIPPDVKKKLQEITDKIPTKAKTAGSGFQLPPQEQSLLDSKQEELLQLFQNLLAEDK